MKSTIISLENNIKWNGFVLRSNDYDFYHCNSYHQLDKSGSPFLFVVEDGADFIALPLIKRSIANTKYYDCTSVYGYSGPVSSQLPENLNPDLIHFFQGQLKEYLHEEKIVSVFSRLHPIISQNKFLTGLGNLNPLNKTVYINLSLSIENQWQQYRKSNRYEINQLRKKGFIIKAATTTTETEDFIRIYTDTMQRVGALPMYYFTNEYFYKFLNSDDFGTELLLAYKDSEIVAGAIFTMAKNIMQYHLAGTKAAFMREAPMKLIIDEARLLGYNKGFKNLHLGGGVGGQDDPLYKFKSGFSDLNCTFETWNYIVDPDIYRELVDEKTKYKKLNDNYFPLYRG